MKEINLRDYYPYYTIDKIVEVPDEVAELLESFERAESACLRRMYRYKAFYSLDEGNGIEKAIIMEQLSPVEILEQQRINVLLYQALAALPDKQSRRIYAHYILGMSISQIARSEGRAFPTVKESIERGIVRLKKFFDENGFKTP